MAGPIGLAVAATAAEAAAAVALVDGLFELAKSAAEVQGKLFDMSQQTGVSVETLSALEELAKTTGGSIEGVVASLGIFQKNLEAIDDGTSKASKALKELNVETNNTEEALRQALAALAKMPEGFHQTALALEIFGRGGKQMLAILKESHGDIDATIKELQGLGLASTASAKKADELNDQLVKLDTQLLGLKVTVGNQVIPTVLNALKDLQKAIKDNKDAVDLLGFAARFTAASIGGQLKLALVSLNLVLATQRPILEQIVDLYERAAAAAQLLTNSVPRIDPNAIPAQKLPAIENGPQVGAEVGGSALAKFGIGAPRVARGGGGSGGRVALDPGVQLLKRLQTEFDNLTPRTRAEEIASELLDSQYAKTNARIKDQILVLSALITQKKSQLEADQKVKDEQARLARVTKDVTDTIHQWAQEVSDLNNNIPDWIARVRDFIAEKAQEGFVWDAETKQILLNTEARREQLKVLAEGATRARRATDFDPTKDAPDNFIFGKDAQLKEFKSRIAEVAGDVSNIFEDLFNNIDRGWKSMLNSLVRDLQSIGSRIVANQIFRLLSNIGASQSTDFIGTKSSGIDALAGKRALGGPVEAGRLYQVNENRMEYFRPNQGGQIIPLGQQQSQPLRVAVFDDMRRVEEWRPDRVLKANKQTRKIGKVVFGT